MLEYTVMTKIYICDQCTTKFSRLSKEESSRRLKGCNLRFCNRDCFNAYQKKNRIFLDCTQCGKNIWKKPCLMKKIIRPFCSRSCAVSYNNTHKTYGTRRSKLEIWLEEQLIKSYSFEIHFNKKDTINSELDIYIPNLKLAFELNGIYHYEPIHGQEKLSSVQNNDHRKFQACLERGIDLCIIDVSTFKHFKENRAREYFKIVKSIIDSKLDIGQP